VLRALFGKHDALVGDELNHASLIDGARLSGARYMRATHGDVASFEALAREARAEDAVEVGFVSDGVFSMDGDLVNLPAMVKASSQQGTTLIVDDAHGFGVLGPQGRGIVSHYAALDPAAASLHPDVYVATLGKSLGAAGAFVAGSEALIEYLIQRARTWVFSTAPPPAIAAAARAALRILETEPEHLRQLRTNIARFRAGAAQLGLPLTPSTTPIQPLVIGNAARAMALSQRMFDRGVWIAAIRPPTVPEGTSRLRITLSAAHTAGHIDSLLSMLAAELAAERGRPESSVA
jgi:8-amino-7-oxononanoate synthase